MAFSGRFMQDVATASTEAGHQLGRPGHQSWRAGDGRAQIVSIIYSNPFVLV
jgi:hypothetical protein